MRSLLSRGLAAIALLSQHGCGPSFDTVGECLKHYRVKATFEEQASAIRLACEIAFTEKWSVLVNDSGPLSWLGPVQMEVFAQDRAAARCVLRSIVQVEDNEQGRDLIRSCASKHKAAEPDHPRLHRGSRALPLPPPRPHLWNEVDKVMPDFRERKEWLRKNGASFGV
jgi:hypothetical protein